MNEDDPDSSNERSIYDWNKWKDHSLLSNAGTPNRFSTVKAVAIDSARQCLWVLARTIVATREELRASLSDKPSLPLAATTSIFAICTQTGRSLCHYSRPSREFRYEDLLVDNQADRLGLPRLLLLLLTSDNKQVGSIASLSLRHDKQVGSIASLSLRHDHALLECLSSVPELRTFPPGLLPLFVSYLPLLDDATCEVVVSGIPPRLRTAHMSQYANGDILTEIRLNENDYDKNLLRLDYRSHFREHKVVAELKDDDDFYWIYGSPPLEDDRLIMGDIKNEGFFAYKVGDTRHDMPCAPCFVAVGEPGTPRGTTVGERDIFDPKHCEWFHIDRHGIYRIPADGQLTLVTPRPIECSNRASYDREMVWAMDRKNRWIYAVTLTSVYRMKLRDG